jgi:hypothetical protein
LATAALVGERGVDEPVEEEPLAGVQHRLDRLLHELRPGGGVEQRLGPGGDVEVGVDDHLANPLGRRDPAGLAEQLDVDPPAGEGVV